MNRHWVLHRHNTHLPRTMGPLPAMLRPFPSVRQRTDRVRRSVTTSSQITRMTTVQVVSDRSVSFSPPSAESQPLRASPEILDARLIDDIHGPPHNAHARFPEFIERREVRRAFEVWAHSDHEVHVAFRPSGAPCDGADDTNLLNVARGRRGTDPAGEAAEFLGRRRGGTPGNDGGRQRPSCGSGDALEERQRVRGSWSRSQRVRSPIGLFPCVRRVTA
jgi:hypothetical protein